MSSRGHFIKKCECGRVMSQCRCPGPNKTVLTHRPCTHKKEALSNDPAQTLDSN